MSGFIEAAAEQYRKAVEKFSSKAVQDTSKTDVQTDSEYDTLNKTKESQAELAKTGEALLNIGIIPDQAMLDAMGIDEATARGIRAIIWMVT